MLLEEDRRFGEFLKIFGKITKRTLTNQLRDLEADGLITRTVYAEVPPRVVYSLSDKGQTLGPALQQLAHWGYDNVLSYGDDSIDQKPTG